MPALNIRLDATVDLVADGFHDTYAPAIDRVWRDGVDTTKADLREWLRRIAENKVWRPWRFELSFGMPVTEHRDSASSPEPVAIEAGATDYKTGKAKAERVTSAP